MVLLITSEIILFHVQGHWGETQKQEYIPWGRLNSGTEGIGSVNKQLTLLQEEEECSVMTEEHEKDPQVFQAEEKLEPQWLFPEWGSIFDLWIVKYASEVLWSVTIPRLSDSISLELYRYMRTRNWIVLIKQYKGIKKFHTYWKDKFVWSNILLYSEFISKC